MVSSTPLRNDRAP